MTPQQRAAILAEARKRALAAPALSAVQRRDLTALLAPAAADLVARKRGRRRSA